MIIIYSRTIRLHYSLLNKHSQCCSSLTCLLVAGSSELMGSDPDAKPNTTSTSAASAQEQYANSSTASTAFDSSSFDSLLEAASSGGMSGDLKSDSNDVLPVQANVSSVSSEKESAGKTALAEALARHNITAQSKAAAIGRGSH